MSLQSTENNHKTAQLAAIDVSVICMKWWTRTQTRTSEGTNEENFDRVGAY